MKSLMKTILAYVLTAPIAFIAYLYMLFGMVLFCIQLFWFLYLGQWFNVFEILNAFEDSKNVGLGHFLKYGALDSTNIFQQKILQSGDIIQEWPAFNKFFFWAVSFHPFIAGLIFSIPVIIIQKSLGVKLPD